jgi:hypothetical protein
MTNSVNNNCQSWSKQTKGQKEVRKSAAIRAGFERNKSFYVQKSIYSHKQQAETCAAVDIRALNILKFTN